MQYETFLKLIDHLTMLYWTNALKEQALGHVIWDNLLFPADRVQVYVINFF